MGLLLVTPRARLRRLLGSPTSLTGKRVLVTGASSGIGAATARAVARCGAQVLLVARRETELLEVRDAVRSEGGSADAYVCDLTDPSDVETLLARIQSDHGWVDLLVNNAGRSIRRSLGASYDRMHDFERTMEINYFAPVRLMLGLLPGMVERGEGHVVNVLSWGVQIKAPKFSAYLASKTALDVFSRIAGRELYADGVSFTNIRLPLVRTDMIGPTEVYHRSRALSAEQAADKVVRALEERPLTVDTWVGRVSEVANLVLPRLSDAVAHRGARSFPDSDAALGRR